MRRLVSTLFDPSERHSHRTAVLASLQMHDQPRTLVEIIEASGLDQRAAHHALVTLIGESIVEAIAPGQFVIASPADARFELAA